MWQQRCGAAEWAKAKKITRAPSDNEKATRGNSVVAWRSVGNSITAQVRIFANGETALLFGSGFGGQLYIKSCRRSAQLQNDSIFIWKSVAATTVSDVTETANRRQRGWKKMQQSINQPGKANNSSPIAPGIAVAA